ncbi:MAG: hypothetical protein ACI9BD_000123 [Candidatus Marinamargulisbacteria bacterium]|jgi:hypothetical protein
MTQQTPKSKSSRRATPGSQDIYAMLYSKIQKELIETQDERISRTLSGVREVDKAYLHITEPPKNTQ